MSVVTSPQPAESTSSQRVEWRAHPARERPWAAMAAATVIGLLAALCAGLGGPWAAVMAVVVLVLSLRRFFFPTRYTIDEAGVTADSLFGVQRLTWSEVRRLAFDHHGAYLSTRSRPSRLDAFRGMHLLFGTSREEVLRAIRGHVPGETP